MWRELAMKGLVNLPGQLMPAVWHYCYAALR
jgi:hypothetical protein